MAPPELLPYVNVSAPVRGPIAVGVTVTPSVQLAAGASVELHEFDVMTNSPLCDAMLMPVSGAPPALTNMTFCDALEVLII